MSTVGELENGPVEIVSFPINSMVIFSSYVSFPEGSSGMRDFLTRVTKHDLSLHVLGCASDVPHQVGNKSRRELG